jgi:HlyD family secretion protein
MRRRVFGFAAVLLLAGCGTPANPTVASVTRGDLVQTVHAAGTVVTATQAKLGFKVGGRIAAINVAVGDRVTQGQVLAELDASDATAALHQAQAARDAANAAVTTAQTKVDQLVASAKPENIAQANAASNIARQKLQDMLAGGRPEQVAQAQADLDAAQQKLKLLESGARPEQIQQAQAGLAQTQAKLQALRNGPRPEQIAVLQKQIDTAKNALYAIQGARDSSCRSEGPSCTVGQAQVNTAQTALDTAQKQFELAIAPPTDTDMQQAQAAVDQAHAQLNLLRANAPEDVQAARDSVDRADQTLAIARSPYTPAQIAQAREAITQADAAAQLAAHPYTDADLAAAQAAVDQARAQAAQSNAAMEAANLNLAGTQLAAPAAGQVLQVNNAVGEVVAAGSGFIVVGAGGLVVNVGLPETSFARVKTGQAAEVTLDATAGKTYSGKVADLPLAGTPTQNIVSYVATITLDQVDDGVHPGANAGVTIYTLRKNGVLLVPNLAVQSYQGKPIVMAVDSDGQTKPAEVEFGLADAVHTEVVSGLKEGQSVLVASALGESKS